MVDIRFDKSPDGKTLIMTAKGHANHAEYGKDIICSAVSMLSYTLAQTVLDDRRRGMLRRIPEVSFDEGDVKIVCKPLKDQYQIVMAQFVMAQTGYDLLHQAYSQNVSLRKFDTE